MLCNDSYMLFGHMIFIAYFLSLVYLSKYAINQFVDTSKNVNADTFTIEISTH